MSTKEILTQSAEGIQSQIRILEEARRKEDELRSIHGSNAAAILNELTRLKAVLAEIKKTGYVS